MAAIIYEGVGGGGELFQGIKFCFLQRVPLRTQWIGHVESNGGEIVKLEKQADIVIADHARKNCPTGSISWTYIRDSVQKGVLEDLDDHRAGPLSYIAREVGSGAPTRQGRTTFTAEDDRVLMDWVVMAERAGLSTKGNEIFKQLEAKNNRHTFQSWRDRWIKYVQFYARPSGLDTTQSNGGSAKTNTKPNPQKSRMPSSSKSPDHSRHIPPPLQATASSPRPVDSSFSSEPVGNIRSSRMKVPDSSQPNPWVARSTGGMNFTEEEVQLLLNVYDDIVNIDEDKAIDAWAAWAVTYPTHTPQEWRNYFVKELTPLVEKRRRKKPVQKDRTSNQGRSSTSRIASPIADTPDIDTVDLQPAAEGMTDPALTDENLFKEALIDLAQELEIGVEFNPVICGRTISLFRLWQVVKEEFGGNDEATGRRLWPQIARKLNFNDHMHTKAANDLEACYGEILADFETAREQFNDPTESQEQAMIEQQLFATGIEQTHGVQDESFAEDVEDDEEDFDDDLNAPQSSPALKLPSKRNSSGRVNQDLASVAESYNKRQRIDKGKGKELEIPSTPEEIINVNQMPPKSYQPSPLKSHDDYDKQDSDDDFSTRHFKQPDFSALRLENLNAEPETQDFHFPSQRDHDQEDGEANSRASHSLASSPLHFTARKRITSTVERKDSDEESSTQSRTESMREAELLEFIDHRIALGYAQTEVIEALEATTMTTGNAGEVMEFLREGKGIPTHIQGVWTARDDAALEEDNSEFERVLAKHGKKRVRQRRRFLEDQRQARRLFNESL